MVFYLHYEIMVTPYPFRIPSIFSVDTRGPLGHNGYPVGIVTVYP